MAFHRHGLLMPALLLAAACVLDPQVDGVQAVARLDVVPDRPDSLHLGARLTLVARLTDASGATLSRRVSWTTHDSAVAVVDPRGVTVGTRPGHTWIVASAGGVSDSVPLHVIWPVGSVRLATSHPVVTIGSPIAAVAVPLDPRGVPIAGRRVRLSSSDERIVRPVGDTVFAALAVGTAALVAESEGRADTVLITVHPPVATVGLRLDADTVDAGTQVTTTVVARDVSGAVLDGLAVSWVSTDSFVIRPDSRGGFRMIRLGPVTLTARVAGVASNSATIVGLARLRTISDNCATDELDRVLCDGNNFLGEAGLGPGIYQAAALTLQPAGMRVRRFSESPTPSAFRCAIKTDGGTICWGHNANGQLGRPAQGACRSPYAFPTPCQQTPLPLLGTDDLEQVVTGGAFACGRSGPGRVWCWGSTNVLGSSASSAPALVPGGHRFRSLAAGSSHICGVDADSAAWCWGRAQGPNAFGSGDTTSFSLAPMRVAGAQRWTAITAGSDHTCALDADGAAWCWGSNINGQLGTATAACQGTGACSETPIPVPTAERFVAVRAAGQLATCALTADGRAVCWGALAVRPVQPGPFPWTTITWRNGTLCGLAGDGRVYCSPDLTAPPVRQPYQR